MCLSDHLSTSGCPTDGRYDAYHAVGDSRPQRPCGCMVGSYCALRAHAYSWEVMCMMLRRRWPDPIRRAVDTVSRSTSLQFSGIKVVLRPDGTYSLSETCGG